MLAYESLLLAYAMEMQATLAIDLMDAICQEGAERRETLSTPKKQKSGRIHFRVSEKITLSMK